MRPERVLSATEHSARQTYGPYRDPEGEEGMITIGVDAHKRIHVAVALNDAGQAVDHWRGPNNPEGWHGLAAWAQAAGAERRWGVEGAGNYGRGLAQHLVALGETVYDINPRWTAKERGRARSTSKTDRLDARAVVLLVWREEGPLPRVAAEDETAVLDLLTTEREDALAEATRLRNQLHQLLLQLDPEYRTHLPHLQSKAGLRAVEDYTTASTSLVQQERAATVRRLARRLRLAVEQAEEVGERIKTRAQAGFPPLTTLCGVNLLTAGARRHPRPRSPLRDRCPTRGLCRGRPAGDLLSRTGAPSPQSRRQPPTQRHPLSHRPHAGAL